jgi:Tfp pilus assembly PilM family ATPase
LQLPPDGIVVDWLVLSNGAGSGGNHAATDIEGVLVAAAKQDVQRHLSILRLAGLYPVILDIGCIAVANLCLALRDTPSEPPDVCIVNLGRRLADIAVLYGEKRVFPRVVFSRAADWESAADYLAVSLQDVLKYYQFKLRQQPLRRVALCGRVPSDPGFIARLREATGVPVETWDPLKDLGSGLRVSRALGDDRDRMGPAMAASLGLALRRS